MLQETPEEAYLVGQSVYCVKYVTGNLIVASCFEESAFHVIDRVSKSVVHKIANPSESWQFQSL